MQPTRQGGGGGCGTATGEMETVVVWCNAHEATTEARRCSVAAVVLQPAKEEAVQGKMGVRASRASDGADKGVLWPDTAALGRMPVTHGHPRVHAARMLCDGRPPKPFDSVHSVPAM